MLGDADVASAAALIGDRTRASFLLALGDVDALPASELAARAGVTAGTASIHLRKLVEGGLLEVERHGRHRYYRLADARVAEAIEALAVIAPTAPVRSLKESNRAEAIRAARTCYDHLAGALGVSLTDALVKRRLLKRANGSVDLSAEGVKRLQALGLDIGSLRRGRRQFARLCLDWSERRYHLAGALGAALTARLFELDWIERTGPTRAVRLTTAGRRGLSAELGFDLPS